MVGYVDRKGRQKRISRSARGCRLNSGYVGAPRPSKSSADGCFGPLLEEGTTPTLRISPMSLIRTQDGAPFRRSFVPQRRVGPNRIRQPLLFHIYTVPTTNFAQAKLRGCTVMAGSSPDTNGGNDSAPEPVEPFWATKAADALGVN